MSSIAQNLGLRNLGLLTLVLLGHLIPTIVIGFGFVIPGSCIDGINQYTLGFISSIVGYIPTFYCGVFLARKLALAEARETAMAG
jgi:ABC-type Fe3+ transport system permease subunit